MRDFDTINMKLYGYDSCDDYYRDASLDAKIHKIRVPTLFLNAVDDMFSTKTDLPIEEIKSNPYTALVKTKHGGHNSFTDTLYPKGCSFICHVLRDYLQAVLEKNDNPVKSNEITTRL